MDTEIDGFASHVSEDALAAKKPKHNEVTFPTWKLPPFFIYKIVT